MSAEQARESFIEWLNGFCPEDVTVIKSHEGGARPNFPYLVVEKGPVVELFTNSRFVKYEELESLNSEGFNEIQASPIVPTQFTMLVSGYGVGAENQLNRIKQAVYISQVQEPMYPVLKIHETGVLNYIPEKVENEWEDRHQMNVELRGVVKDGFVIDTIDSQEFDFNQTNEGN